MKFFFLLVTLAVLLLAFTSVPAIAQDTEDVNGVASEPDEFSDPSTDSVDDSSEFFDEADPEVDDPTADFGTEAAPEVDDPSAVSDPNTDAAPEVDDPFAVSDPGTDAAGDPSGISDPSVVSDTPFVGPVVSSTAGGFPAVTAKPFSTTLSQTNAVPGPTPTATRPAFTPVPSAAGNVFAPLYLALGVAGVAVAFS